MRRGTLVREGQQADEATRDLARITKQEAEAVHQSVGNARGRYPEYGTDSFERIQSSPSPSAGDLDPVQSG